MWIPVFRRSIRSPFSGLELRLSLPTFPLISVITFLPTSPVQSSHVIIHIPHLNIEAACYKRLYPPNRLQNTTTETTPQSECFNILNPQFLASKTELYSLRGHVFVTHHFRGVPNLVRPVHKARVPT